jgi:hypothetical protein
VIRLPGRPPEPRPLVTLIRSPAIGSPSEMDLVDASPRRAGGPFPLVVFGHGYAVTPKICAPLLQV